MMSGKPDTMRRTMQNKIYKLKYKCDRMLGTGKAKLLTENEKVKRR